MKNEIKFPSALLFDFDGVIVDSFQSHYGAWKEAFHQMFGKEIVSFPHEELSGKSPYLIAEYFCTKVNQPEKAKDYFELKCKLLNSNTTPPNLLPGVKEIQEFLAKNNIPHGIASNASKHFVKLSVSQLKLGFKTFFGLEDFKNPKPHPEAYITLAKHLNIPETSYANTWVFEDSITGTQAANEAGMIPIGILTMNTKEDMRKAGSQLFFPTLLEAFHYLKEIDTVLE
jgi:beta-phosphoglucomutase